MVLGAMVLGAGWCEMRMAVVVRMAVAVRMAVVVRIAPAVGVVSESRAKGPDTNSVS